MISAQPPDGAGEQSKAKHPDVDANLLVVRSIHQEKEWTDALWETRCASGGFPPVHL